MMNNDNSAVGAVLVVGGGIAGMQAALDCANSGLKVYLVEEQPSIGGNMARLDKTFPTNDCAMCILSPKLVEIGRHLNIEIIANADLKKLQGSAGRFRAVINKRARFVNEELCNGCGDCERACPVLRKDRFNGELSEHSAIYRLYPQAIPNVYTIAKAAQEPPCRGTCPAGVNAQGYVALISKGKFLEALDVVRERMPFAGVCGRVCHHPCESACNRAKIDEAVAVRNLKRFVSDYEWNLMKQGASIERPPSEAAQPERQEYQERVAVVGGGPAGLTCAGDLNRLGYRVTVFEAATQLGGMMRQGIPAYRLPRELLDHEIDLVVGENIDVRTGAALGRDFTLTDLQTQGYASIFLATGAHLPKRIPLEGGDAKGVLYGTDFLREVNAGNKPVLGRRVAVIGGGNVAMDVARCAARTNPSSSISLYCLESRAEMPAYEWEIREAFEEGVSINPSWGPASVLVENGEARGLELVKCLRVFDEEKRFNPFFDTKVTTRIETDTIILAVGQVCDLSFVNGHVATARGVIDVDRLTIETSMKGVFAGGDNVLGPASLVQAVEQGHRAAESIHRYLRGMDMSADRRPVERDTEFADIPPDADCAARARIAMAATSPAERKQSFLEIDSGYTEEMAVAEAQRCLNCGLCSLCKECVRVCKARAIDHDMKDIERELEVGAVIATSGYDVFDPVVKAEYGFGRFPNVITSMQFERILSASGPYEGQVRRPSDGATPKKIAWIQCIGSRDATLGRKYCSSVCCMYATKEAIIAKEHEHDLDTTIFFIDMRAFGKGYEEFYNRAKETYGVRYVRSQVSSLKENPANKNIVVRYVDETNGRGNAAPQCGQSRQHIVEEEFDMVVLSVGLTATLSANGLAAVLGVGCNPYGFIRGNREMPLLSDKDGVFLSGAITGPKDISETVMESSAAAALCGQMLGAVRGTQVRKKEYPPERDVAGEPPRIGVFVCHCGTNIASVVDVAAVTDYVKNIPGVVYTEHTLYSCSQDTQERIKEIIREKELNRIIVASCTPRTHEPLFQETLREAGLNKYLFEMADIREQCAWVHQQERGLATEKAKALVRGSIGKAKYLEPLQFKRVGVTRSALIIGGGMAGLTAALSLARQGFKAHLVEKTDQLGGQLRHVKRSLDGYDWQRRLDEVIEEAKNHPAITLHLNAEVAEITGFVGNFKTRLKRERRTPVRLELGEDAFEIQHGVTIIATGAQEYQPEAFLFGRDARVITQRDLERMLESQLEINGAAPKSVVMIQCVGSRDKERPYCSRVCCGAAIKNALTLKRKYPDADVYVLYRDIRTYQYREEHYWQARNEGVRFIHFPDEQYPEVVPQNGRLAVTVQDTVLNETLTLPADWVVLSVGIVPDRESNARFSELAKISLDEQGFFMEAHVKLRPVDFANEGIFVCGLAHSPKYTEENIVQALAAAGRAACILAKEFLEVGGVISQVDPDKCATCLTCVRECAYQAPFVNADGKAQIEEAKCQGCGNCAAACPAKAIQLKSFTDIQEQALVRHILVLNEEDSQSMTVLAQEPIK